MHQRFRSTALALFLGTSSLTIGGCVAFADKNTSEWGDRISDNTVAQIEIGKTGWQFLQAAFGDPDNRRKVEGRANYEIWTYDYNRVEQSQVYVLFIFAGTFREAEKRTAYFELTDWVITKAWVE